MAWVEQEHHFYPVCLCKVLPKVARLSKLCQLEINFRPGLKIDFRPGLKLFSGLVGLNVFGARPETHFQAWPKRDYQAMSEAHFMPGLK